MFAQFDMEKIAEYGVLAVCLITAVIFLWRDRSRLIKERDDARKEFLDHLLKNDKD